ncbi:biotin--[acetyl-CoA-carboxylase] ligase [Teichococcus oryzae]|uniref:biotin--[biotin carboxyl-carrier protein] ligase n=1 Tax=Teichococcus oryzae TaxID=1608942 RepID=A0A5B2TE23_9PROT|nr:biotin--[acetyl-CoA-carboxylase] ligase [Pseudoroseomonas oryzae]KAA2212737.1 biotin--[acetyl-CoA-carboxylase] ligase [Pseudoroseomonas oryzae]
MSFPSGSWRLSVHDELASTQDAVLAAAADGEPEGLAILARRQSAGRGTQGRSWRSPPGNLYLSLLWRPGGAIRDLPQWSLMAAVALAECARGFLPDGAPLALKWPNDLLLGGAKCAGILTDASADAEGGLAWVVFGLGVNLAHAPELPDRPTASFAQAGLPPPDPARFAGALLRTLAEWRQRQARLGFACVRQAWLGYGPAIGGELELRRGGEAHRGRFLGLADDGRLLLDVGGTARAFVSGEIAG